MSCIVYSNVTGEATPAQGGQSMWPADSTAVSITNDILDNIDIIAPAADVATGQVCVVYNPHASAATVYNINGGTDTVPSGQCRTYIYVGGWRVAS